MDQKRFDRIREQLIAVKSTLKPPARDIQANYRVESVDSTYTGQIVKTMDMSRAVKTGTIKATSKK